MDSWPGWLVGWYANHNIASTVKYVRFSISYWSRLPFLHRLISSTSPPDNCDPCIPLRRQRTCSYPNFQPTHIYRKIAGMLDQALKRQPSFGAKISREYHEMHSHVCGTLIAEPGISLGSDMAIRDASSDSGAIIFNAPVEVLRPGFCDIKTWDGSITSGWRGVEQVWRRRKCAHVPIR
ncbi:hypothetical protein IQ06DRAFT_55679 [Phaeosphaeriaceae sp. SRC1lsM3a]|nr:hypothetical protein IQ06DRAFT_55679 [Stagonospora sp. SRC1lsM3a]